MLIALAALASLSADPMLLDAGSAQPDAPLPRLELDGGGETDAGAPLAELDAGFVDLVAPPSDADAGTAGPTGPTGFEGVATLGQNKKLPKGFTGVIGRVIDSKSGEGLIEATIKVVVGGKKSALTDLDGYYRLKLPPGAYDLRIFYELYEGRRVSNVEVKKGEAVTLDVALDRDSRAVQEVVVEAKVDKRNESALLQERKRAAVVQDSVGAQEIARTPDSSAGEAAKRVVSVTLSEGKYVFIRGLGGRYAQTLVNSTVMPSPEPDEPSVPLDLFPTALVSNLNVIKTYSADLPGQFGGGSLTVDTNTFPTELDVRVRAQLSGDTATTFQSRPSSPSSNIEAFGFRDPERNLPSTIPTDRIFQQSNDPNRPGVTPDEQQKGGRSLPNRWTPGQVSAAPNGSIGAQAGNSFKLGKESRLGVLAALQWNRREQTRRTYVADVSLTENGLEVENPTDSVSSSVSAATSGLVNVGLQINRDNEVSLLMLALSNAENQAVTAQGPETISAMQNQANNRLQFTQRVLSFNQLKGFHRLNGFGDLEIDWQLNYARVNRTEPDIRDTRYFLADGTNVPTLRIGQPNSAERFFLDLTENSGGGGANVTIPWRSLRVKVGAFGQYQARFFDGRRLQVFSLTREPTTGLAEDVLTRDVIGPGAGTKYFLTESTLVQDRYTSTLSTFGGFALVEWKPTDWVRGQVGVRYEGSTQTVRANSPFASGGGAVPDVERTNHNPLPSVNLTFAPAARVNLRAAYALTLARPSFRELGPFLFFDMIRRRNVSGNPDLKQTDIHHADLRAEWFPSDNEVFAASVFGKQFVRPIERVVIGQASSFDFGFRNADGATLVGLELEARTSLGRIAQVLKGFRLGGNASLIWSRVQLSGTAGQLGNPNRPLQGQSPWVANAFITWTKEDWGTEAGVFYNVYGPRITEVAVAPVPDFTEQPFHKIDFTVSQNVGHGFQLKVSVANAFDQRVRITQGNVEVFRYAPGVQFNASLAWALPGLERKQP